MFKAPGSVSSTHQIRQGKKDKTECWLGTVQFPGALASVRAGSRTCHGRLAGPCSRLPALPSAALSPLLSQTFFLGKPDGGHQAWLISYSLKANGEQKVFLLVLSAEILG